MATTIVNGQAVKNLPWEERPAGCPDVVWRYSGNPIIPRYPFPGAQNVYNSAAIVDAPTGRIALYYGATDTRTALCFCRADEVLAFLGEHSTVF